MPLFRKLTTAALVALLPVAAQAQLRPSIDVETFVQWPNINERYINPGMLHAGLGITTPLVRGESLSWVASLRVMGMVSGSGENADCLVLPGKTGCWGHMDVTPRGALLTGGAYRNGPVVLQAQGGVARFEREWGGAKNAPQARVDAAFMFHRHIGLTLSATRAWLGDHLDQSLQMSSAGLGLRWTP
ncbi:hypothetical protein [Gemmatimonas aurantiaca]|uniref:hypothetical protein n=1 Tax=Gemmatimonas aurantiaca TaxID=173480 RepID=UPI00301DBCE3